LPVEVQRLFWSRIRDAEILDDAARLVGVSKSVALRWFREAGGVTSDAAPAWCHLDGAVVVRGTGRD